MKSRANCIAETRFKNGTVRSKPLNAIVIDMDKSSLNSIEKDLIEGLEGFVKDLKSDAVIPEKYTCRRVILDLQPHPFTPEQVKATRKQLRASQALFAQFLGVSPRTIAAWERGAKKPKEVACRFMDEIQRDPDYWRKRLCEAIKTRHAAQ